MGIVWNTTILDRESDLLSLLLELSGRRWLHRGHSKPYVDVKPTLDRKSDLDRLQKLELERRGIEIFRTNARFFADDGEKLSLSNVVVALMVLQHYGVPTRLLDWSFSPYVATYFAVEQYDHQNGEILCFDEPYYEVKGKDQWSKWPQTTIGGSPDKFDATLTMFSVQEPPDWIICGFYPLGFPRQHAQSGAYTLTARFERDHSQAIANLLDDHSRFHKYVIAKELKPRLRNILREQFGIWRGSLFPDSAGAAETVNKVVFNGGI